MLLWVTQGRAPCRESGEHWEPAEHVWPEDLTDTISSFPTPYRMSLW